MIVLSLSTQGLLAQTAPTTPPLKDGEEAVVRTMPATIPEGVTSCAIEGERPSRTVVCCEGYSVNQAGFCDEPVMEDKSLKYCGPVDEHSEPSACPSGLACMPQSPAVMFSRLAPTSDSVETIRSSKQELDAQVNDYEPKGAGASCAHPKECASYNCKSGKCEEKLVCRMAGENEVAGAGVNCGPDLVLNQQTGKCELSAEAKNTVYLGLLDEVQIRDAGQCQFELDKETKDKALVAMKSLRAAEYFLTTVTLEPQRDECFMTVPLLKYEVETMMYETRKVVLENFTTVLNEIEKDYATVMTASQNYSKAVESNGKYEGSEKPVEVHGEKPISEGTLGSRVLSGYDALVIMKRRNALFQSYEMAMLEVMKQIGPKVTGLNTNMANWNDGDSSWNTGSQTVSGPCEGSKYKKKKRWKWTTKYYETTKDRWAWHFEVTGNAPGNADIVNREKVKNILGLLSGYAASGSTDEQKAAADAAVAKAVQEFTSPKFFMMDPFMYGGMMQGTYGQTKSLGKKGGFLGFSGFKDLRNARYIRGDEGGSFTSMHRNLSTNVQDFYKSLKTKKDQKTFVYEPELVTTYAKDCLDSARTEKCDQFDKFLQDVTDESFAYFLAHGFHTTDSYTNYFRNAMTYRRKLLAKLEVDIQNIGKYYEKVIDYRVKQNTCIDKVLANLDASGIIADESGGGVEEGNSNKPTGVNVKPGRVTGLNNNTANATAGKKLNVPKLNAVSRNKFLFNLRDTNMSSLNDSTKLDNVGGIGSTSVDSASVDGAGGTNFFAIRSANMKKANQIASSKGVNVAGKDKAAKGIQSSIAKSSGSGSMIGGSSINTARGAFGFGGVGDSSVSKSALDGSSGPTGEGVKGSGEIGMGDKTGAGADGKGANGEPLVNDPYGSGAYGANGGADGAGGANGAFGKNGSGLSEEEQNRLLSEAERNKKDYNGSDDDGLFKKVSKAYVRNLDKVLIKKKKVD